jgi:hypothetical protein
MNKLKEMTALFVGRHVDHEVIVLCAHRDRTTLMRLFERTVSGGCFFFVLSHNFLPWAEVGRLEASGYGLLLEEMREWGLLHAS